MQKIGLSLILIAFLIGCGTAAQKAEFRSHDSHYKNWEHLKFSWAGHKKPTREDAKMSALQGWWGDPINYTGEGD